LYTATPGSTEFAHGVRKCLESEGVDVSVFEKFRPGSTDFSAFLLKVRQTNAEVLISGGFFPDHLVLVRQMREHNISVKGYIGPWGVAYPGFIKEVGDASEQLFGMCAWSPGITLPGTGEESEAFVTGFFKRFGKLPNTTTMHGYSSARALLTSIGKAQEKGNALSGDSIREELDHLDLMLPMERLAFDEKGDPKYYKQAIVQIQNGRMVAVYPEKRAAGKMIYPMVK
jgi:branched-chain amino acid transport system substrate-binding protein